MSCPSPCCQENLGDRVSSSTETPRCPSVLLSRGETEQEPTTPGEWWGSLQSWDTAPAVPAEAAPAPADTQHSGAGAGTGH